MKRIQIILFIGLLFGMIACDFGYPCLNVYTSHNVYASLYSLNGDVVKEGEKVRYDSLKIFIQTGILEVEWNHVCSKETQIGGLADLEIITHITDSLGNLINEDTITGIFQYAFVTPITKEETTPEDIENLIRKSPKAPIYLALYFKQPPTDTAAWQRFEVIYEEIDGRIFRDTTQKVFVLP